MTQAEEIYERFVQYEWREVDEQLKKSIIEAINQALHIHGVSGKAQHCPYCGSLDWTIKEYGLVLHKKMCPYHQGNVVPGASGTDVIISP